MRRYLSDMLWVLALCLPLAALTSCGGKDKIGDVIPVIVKALNQSSSIWYGDFDRFPESEDRSQLPIGVLDSGTEGLAILETMLDLDYLNNIDGYTGSDGIPDFHGEDFQYFADLANMPYETYPSVGKTDYLRELAVKNALFLLGDRYYNLSSDRSAKGIKPRCKIIVVSCPTAAAYGAADIRKMLELSKTGVKVIDVINAGANAAVDDIVSSEKLDSLSVGIMAAAEGSDAYGRTIRQISEKRGHKGYIHIVNQKDAGLVKALDMDEDYVDSSSTEPRESYKGPVLGAGAGDIKEELLDVYNFDFENGAILYRKEKGKYTEIQLNSASNYARFHLVSLLEQIRSSREQAPLKSIILGSANHQFLLDTLNKAVRELKKYRKNGKFVYSHLIAEDLKFINPAVFTAIECCKALREDKLMALRTRKGNIEAFISVPSYQVDTRFLEEHGGLTDSFKYGRIPGTEELPTVVVPYSYEKIKEKQN